MKNGNLDRRYACAGCGTPWLIQAAAEQCFVVDMTPSEVPATRNQTSFRNKVAEVVM